MELQTLLDSLRFVDDELYGLQQKRQSLTSRLSGYTTRKQGLEDEILELRTAAANGGISYTDIARLEQLKVESDDAASREKEIKRILKVNGDAATALQGERNVYMADVKRQRAIDNQDEIKQLYASTGKDAAIALGKFAAMVRLKDGTPLGALDGTELANLLIHASPGVTRRAYETESARYLHALTEEEGRKAR